MKRVTLCCASLASLLTLLGVSFAAAPSGTNRPPPLGLPAQADFAGVPIGELPGGAQSDLASTIHNAGSNDVSAGRNLYLKLNCADCHGFQGQGLIGPSLKDGDWRFGGTPAAIYKSIFEGRSKGMPAWGLVLPPKDIWQLVAYIQSLGATTKPSAYQPGLQGDEVGEQITPEMNFEQAIHGSPPYQSPSQQTGTRPQTKHHAFKQ